MNIKSLFAGGLRLAGALLLTVSMFLCMGFLIAPQDVGPVNIEQVPNVSITRVERDEESEQKRRHIPPEPEMKKAPPPPPIKVDPNLSPSENDGPVVELPGVDKNFDPTAMPSDRQATPLVRIPPQYPQRAITSGTEGWVLVEFTITGTGAVENVRVLEAEPSSVFNSAAIRAIERWKYQPKVVNGRAVERPFMRELIRFQLEH